MKAIVEYGTGVGGNGSGGTEECRTEGFCLEDLHPAPAHTVLLWTESDLWELFLCPRLWLYGRSVGTLGKPDGNFSMRKETVYVHWLYF